MLIEKKRVSFVNEKVEGTESEGETPSFLVCSCRGFKFSCLQYG